MTTNNVTIGIDLGDRRHAVCVLSAAGETVSGRISDVSPVESVILEDAIVRSDYVPFP